MESENTIEKNRSCENIAVNYLKTRGYRILARNKKINGIEIDILTRRKLNNTFIYSFIEVKKTKKKAFYSGYPPISFRQLQRYRQAIVFSYILNKKPFFTEISLIVFDENKNLLSFISSL